MNIQPNLGHPGINPNNQLPQVDVSSSIGQTEYYQQQIFSLLDGEGQNEVSNFFNSFEILIKQLESEVTNISLHFDSKLDYKSLEYNKRVSLSDDFIQNAFKIILKQYPKLNNIYSQIIQLLSNIPNGDLILKQIFETYFYDLVIAHLHSLPEYSAGESEVNTYVKELHYDDYKKVHMFEFNKDTSFSSSDGLLSDSNINIQYLLKADYIDFSNINFNLIDFNVLRVLFSLKPTAKSWLIKHCSLCGLNSEQVLTVFSNALNLRTISLIYSDIHNLSFDNLQIIFSNLRNIKIIKLDGIDIGLMDTNTIEMIFSNLKNARHVSLEWTKLGQLSNKALDIIFTNLRGVKFLLYREMDYLKIKWNTLNQNIINYNF